MSGRVRLVNGFLPPSRGSDIRRIREGLEDMFEEDGAFLLIDLGCEATWFQIGKPARVWA